MVTLVAWIGRNDRLQTICAALLLAVYPVYFYVGHSIDRETAHETLQKLMHPW